MINKVPRNDSRKRRHQRIRRKLSGTPERPRLNVFRSLKHVYAQIIDDQNSRTLISASSLDPEIKKDRDSGNNQEVARVVGQILGRRAKAADISQVIFDRGGYLYHGRVKALADAVRKEGIEF